MPRRFAIFAALTAALALAACKDSSSGVRITAEKQAPAQIISKPRSEPIFFNGKTYKLDFAPGAQGAYDMAVGGMSAKQEKDAVQLATSSLRYYACPDGMTGKLVSGPTYSGGQWKLSARCA